MIGALAMTVLIFVSTECPISNRYAPEIRRLHDEFASRGLRFRLIYPNRLDGEAAVSKHVKDFDYPPIAERDGDHRLVKVAGASWSFSYDQHSPKPPSPKSSFTGHSAPPPSPPAPPVPAGPAPPVPAPLLLEV